MSLRTRCSFTAAAVSTFVFLAGGFVPIVHSAEPPDKAQSAPEQQPAKPMIKKEPMAGEMKKDGMMKEDVSKAAKKWDEKMEEMLETPNGWPRRPISPRIKRT